MIKITVTKISDGSLIAEDFGESVTQESLRIKMLEKGINIEDAAYSIAIDNSFDPLKTRKALKEKGKQAKQACDNQMAIINGYGQDLTAQEESDLMTNHGSALQLLQLNKAWTWKAYVEAIDTAVDSVITTQMKQDLLDQLAEDGI